MGRVKVASKVSFIAAQGPGLGQKMIHSTSKPHFSSLACRPAVKLSHLKGCSWKCFWQNREHGTSGSAMRGRCCSDIREISGCFSPKTHVWVYPRIFPWPHQGRVPHRQASGVSQKPVVSISSPVKRNCRLVSLKVRECSYPKANHWCPLSVPRPILQPSAATASAEAEMQRGVSGIPEDRWAVSQRVG